MNQKLKYALGIAGTLLLLAAIWYFRHIVVYIIVSAAIAVIGQPIMQLLSKIKIKNRKLPVTANAAITLATIWFIVFTFFRIFVPIVINEINILSTVDSNLLYDRFEQPLRLLFDRAQKIGYIDNQNTIETFITSKISSVLNVEFLSNMFSGLTSALGSIIIGIFSISFITFFFLKDALLFKKGVLIFVPDHFSDETTRALDTIRHLLVRYLSGICIQVLLIATLITLGLWIIGIDFQHAIICGLIAGILNVIPYIGPWIGAIFSIVICTAANINLPFDGGLQPLLIHMLIVFVIVQTLDNIVFQPVIFSNSVNAHPLEIFIVILMAGSFSGIIGMILAIPSYTVFRVIAKEFLSSIKIFRQLSKNI